MGYFGQLGATASTTTTGWSMAKYDATAEAKAEATPGNFLIITVGWEGAYVRAESFPTYALASAAWDAKYTPGKNLPDDMAYALLYNKTNEQDWRSVENNFNLLRSKSRVDWRSQVPWIVAGGVVLVAAVYFTRTRKRAPGRRKKRPFWRRRVVTTWR